MSYTKQTWTNNVSAIDEDKMNHIEDGIYQNSVDIEKIKVANFTALITPSTNRGNCGYGETTVDISSLDATQILAITFNATSSYMLYGINSNLTTNLTSVQIYGYRIPGTYTGTIDVSIKILYKS